MYKDDKSTLNKATTDSFRMFMCGFWVGIGVCIVLFIIVT